MYSSKIKESLGIEGAIEIIKLFPFILLLTGLIRNPAKEKWDAWCKVILTELVTKEG